MAIYKQLQAAFNSTELDLQTKLKIFTAYVTNCVFTYNSKVWALTKEQENRLLPQKPAEKN